MGYTHYFEKPKNFEASISQRTQAVTLVKALLGNLPEHSDSAGGYYKFEPLIVQREDDDPSQPMVDENVILFNGASEFAHETFCFEFGPTSHAFNFCKTAGKPYDLAVISTLVILKYIFGSALNISSDGDLGDWESGIPTVRESLSAAGILPEDFPSCLTFGAGGNIQLK